MKFLSVVVATLLFSSACLADAPDKLSKIPKDVILEGLTMVSVCVGTESAGITILAKLVRDQRSEPSQNSQQIMQSIYKDSKILLAGIQSYSTIASGMIEDLVKHHDAATAELSSAVEQEVKDTRKDIIAKLNDVADYADFQEKFEPILTNCNNATVAYGKKIDAILEKQ